MYKVDMLTLVKLVKLPERNDDVAYQTAHTMAGLRFCYTRTPLQYMQPGYIINAINAKCYKKKEWTFSQDRSNLSS